MALYMSTRRAAPGWLPLKVGCMFSRMDEFNPLHRYHQMRSSIPSVDGQMWCGSDVNAGTDPSTISQRRDSEPELYRGKRTGPKQCYAVYESGDGSAWAGTLNGGVSKFKDGHFTTYTTTNGLASNTVSSILETRDGAMWFATPSGLSSFSKRPMETYTAVEGLPSPEVNCLFEDFIRNSLEWNVCWSAFFASNRFQVPHESPDVLREQIVGMAEDKSGRFLDRDLRSCFARSARTNC